MGATKQELEHDPSYWWLRLTYAREKDMDGVAESRRRLAELGVDVSLRSVEAFSRGEVRP